MVVVTGTVVGGVYVVEGTDLVVVGEVVGEVTGEVVGVVDVTLEPGGTETGTPAAGRAFALR